MAPPPPTTSPASPAPPDSLRAPARSFHIAVGGACTGCARALGRAANCKANARPTTCMVFITRVLPRTSPQVYWHDELSVVPVRSSRRALSSPVTTDHQRRADPPPCCTDHTTGPQTPLRAPHSPVKTRQISSGRLPQPREVASGPRRRRSTAPRIARRPAPIADPQPCGSPPPSPNREPTPPQVAVRPPATPIHSAVERPHPTPFGDPQRRESPRASTNPTLTGL